MGKVKNHFHDELEAKRAAEAGFTALDVALSMPLPAYAREALLHERKEHPQVRTLAFHTFYGQPIRSQKPDETFSHMSDERVAFRASFILSEVLELLEKGLGIRVRNIIMDVGPGKEINCVVKNDASLCHAIHAAMKHTKKRDLVETVDALGDLNVVVNGFAVELGVNMIAVDREICASNFTKAGEGGEPIIGDGITGPVGKVMKGPNYTEPQIAVVLGLTQEKEDA